MPYTPAELGIRAQDTRPYGESAREVMESKRRERAARYGSATPGAARAPAERGR